MPTAHRHAINQPEVGMCTSIILSVLTAGRGPIKRSKDHYNHSYLFQLEQMKAQHLYRLDHLQRQNEIGQTTRT